jgi:ferredoxin-NADP reductase
VYACGPEPMLAGTLHALAEAGMEVEHVRYETFTYRRHTDHTSPHDRTAPTGYTDPAALGTSADYGGETG